MTQRYSAHVNVGGEEGKRREIRLLEGNAKRSFFYKLTCKGTLRQVFICLMPKTQYPPPPYTQYTCTQCAVLIHTVCCAYSHSVLCLFTQGRREGARVESEKRGEGQQFTKLPT
jgi:hypothetical protein